MAELARGNFRLRSMVPALLFEASFDDDAPMPTDDSYSGWEIVSIPKRMGLTEWQGRNPMGLQINFYIDRLNRDTDRSPGAELRALFYNLSRMAITNTRDEEPPPLIFNSNGLCPYDYEHNPGTRWVIESLSWDRARTVNNIWSNPIFLAGELVIRQHNTDTFLGEYVGPAHRNKKRNKKKGGKPKPKHKRQKYVTVGGSPDQPNTLLQVASFVYGDAAQWKTIADANGIRNPRGLEVGQRLIIP